MEPSISKNDENSLKMEESVIQTQVISLEEIQSQLSQITASMAVLNGHLTYYQGLMDKATEFNLKLKEDTPVMVNEEIINIE